MMLIFIVNTLLTSIYELGSGRLPSKSRNTHRERVLSRPRPKIFDDRSQVSRPRLLASLGMTTCRVTRHMCCKGLTTMSTCLESL